MSVFVVLETSSVQGANETSFPVIILNHHRTFLLLPTQASFPSLGHVLQAL